MSLVYPPGWTEPTKVQPLNIKDPPSRWASAKAQLNTYLTNNGPQYPRDLVRVIRDYCINNYANMPILADIKELIAEVQAENKP